MRQRAWAFFWLLGMIWGSSFLFIRVGVKEFSPGEVVFYRTFIAAVGLNLVLFMRGKRLPSDRGTLKKLAILGIGNTVAPFLLISWGEVRIESSIASVLQATATLFALVVAHFSFTDERITPQRVIGLVTGFIGVVVLSSREWGSGSLLTGGFIGQMAIVAASLFYAIFTVYSRKVIQGNVEPVVVAAGTMTTAALVAGILVFGGTLVGGPALTDLSTVSHDTLIAMFLLGFVNTFIAYMFFYFIVRELGAARAAMVTYIVPVVGLILGILVADETFDMALLFGAALIFSGIGIVNMRSRWLTRRLAAQAGD